MASVNVMAGNRAPRVAEAQSPVTAPPGWALRWMHPAAIATLVANILIVVTGGGGRLTGPGLGCPPRPRRPHPSFVPPPALGGPSAIRVSNPVITFVVAAGA